MQKDKKAKATKKAQTGKAVKKGLPIKNATTDAVKNTASQTGLNQARTRRDDLFPSDGDNMTR
jgi:hypothetical protein